MFSPALVAHIRSARASSAAASREYVAARFGLADTSFASAAMSAAKRSSARFFRAAAPDHSNHASARSRGSKPTISTSRTNSGDR